MSTKEEASDYLLKSVGARIQMIIMREKGYAYPIGEFTLMVLNNLVAMGLAYKQFSEGQHDKYLLTFDGELWFK
jgi:hypothetical protein